MLSNGTARRRGRAHRRKVFSPLVIQFEDRLLLSDIPVTSSADSGAGTLREALAQAVAGDHVVFQIPSTDPGFNPATGSWTIGLVTPLNPVFTSAITIDGLTQHSQPGASAAHPVIQITAAGSFSSDGLFIASSGNTIRGLVINGFDGYGIVLSESDAGANGNLITGNYIGTDVTGTTDVPNVGGGIWVEFGSGNTIGGNVAAERNVISGNSGDGVVIGSAPDSGGFGNIVLGNFIGLDASGVLELGNNGHGVTVLSSFNEIGGTEPADGNRIAANSGSGVLVNGGIANAVLSNLIFNNSDQGILLANDGNHGQVAPILSQALVFSNRTVIQGSLAVVADTSYLVQYYGNNPASGQGRTLLGSQAIAAQGSSGFVPLSFTTGAVLPAGASVTAIVSVVSVAGETSDPAEGDTSAFSTAVILVNPFIVTNTRDFGLGSLRFAIDTANADTTNDDTIIFRIPSSDPGYVPATGSWTIFVFSALTIDKFVSEGPQHSVVIDGLTQQSQPGAATGHPVIELTPGTESHGQIIPRGVLAPAVNGLTIRTGGNTVRGLVINRFPGDGIAIVGTRANGNRIESNFLGTDVTGTVDLGNFGSGLSATSTANTIGVPAAGNLISGNQADGVILSGVANLIQANLIGTDVSGSRALPNGVSGSASSGAGVRILASRNQVVGNVISANVNEGMFLVPKTSGMLIQGNVIGTNAAGTAALGNGLSGITLSESSGNTIIGNLLSGNGTRPVTGNGISVAGQSNDNLIAGNLIGTDLSGTRAIPNSAVGVFIVGQRNTVGGTSARQGNVISGNAGLGILFSGASSNEVVGNVIGLGIDGVSRLGNTFDGIVLRSSNENTIAGNAISANGVNEDAAGISLETNNQRNVISGNLIGTDVTGTVALGNSLHGVFLGDGSIGNTVGGTTPADRNIISGNGSFPVADPLTQGGVGVFVYGSGSSGNLVAGNFIGTNSTGSAALTGSVIGVLISQSPGNVIQGNLISGHQFVGLEIAGATAAGNQVQGNLIGVNATGDAAIRNQFDGIFINGASNNTIGGTTAGAGNLISGNGSVGIQIFGASQGNVVQGNALGLDAAGGRTLPNLAGGIFINTNLSNEIGGTAAGEPNVGQSRPIVSLSALHPSKPHSGLVTGTARQVKIGRARKGTGAGAFRRNHWPIVGGGVNGKARPGLPPKGMLSIRANSPLNGKGPVTGRT